MKKKRIVFSLSTILASTSAITIPLISSCSSSEITDVHIVSFNDFHGRIPGNGQPYKTSSSDPGSIRFFNQYNEFVKQNPNTILLSAGDNSQGNAFSNVTYGESVYDTFKQMGVVYSALGNHEFDWGLDYFDNENNQLNYDEVARTEDTIGNYFINANIINGTNYRDYS